MKKFGKKILASVVAASMLLGMISGVIPICRRSSFLLGEPEAKIIILFPLYFLPVKVSFSSRQKPSWNE